jgi:hypothetical protein
MVSILMVCDFLLIWLMIFVANQYVENLLFNQLFFINYFLKCCDEHYVVIGCNFGRNWF